MSSVVDGLPFAEEKKKYIIEVLDPVLEEMVSEVLTDMPKVPLDFMIAWLQKRAGTTQSNRVSLQSKNHKLKNELKQVQGALHEAGTCITHQPKEEAHDSAEEEDEDEEPPESFVRSEEQLGRARQSVSAEAYGQWNQKKAFIPPKHEKTAEQEGRLKQTLLKSFMFADLDPQDMETVVGAMKEFVFTPGQKVMVEGEDGDSLYVIERGALECIKHIDGEDKVVKTCSTGDVFGELALLYNCPRAATVKAKDEAICWQLDRESFNAIVKDASMKRRNKYEGFLKGVALISGMDAYERSQIADALKVEVFKKGDAIVKQDEPGDKFYIVEEGTLFAMKLTNEGERRVMDYKPGDCFGELALLKNQPRAASIIVSSDVAKVLVLGRTSFNKMLGPLQDILMRQVASYK